MPLTLVDVNHPYVIGRISGNDKVRAHLNGLGFVEGTEVTVVARTASGIIVNVRDSRIALGQDLARRVFV